MIHLLNLFAAIALLVWGTQIVRTGIITEDVVYGASMTWYRCYGNTNPTDVTVDDISLKPVTSLFALFIGLVSVFTLGVFFGNRCPLEFRVLRDGVVMRTVSARASPVNPGAMRAVRVGASATPIGPSEYRSSLMRSMRSASVSMPCSTRKALNGEIAAPMSRSSCTRALMM